MAKKTVTTAVVVVALALSGAVHGDLLGTVDMAYTGYGAKDYVTIWGGGNNNRRVGAGVFMFDKSGGTGQGNFWDNGPVAGFCIDLTESASYSTITYDVIMPQDGPIPTDFLGESMGAEKARYLQELWGRFFDPAWMGSGHFTSEQKRNAGAFAAAVWEIVYEQLPDSPENWNVSEDGTDGALGFRLKKGDVATANNWLHALNGTGPKANLRALSFDGKQDFIVEVPEPATVALLTFGSFMLLCRKLN